ncbi:MAG: peptide chain release factor H [Roseibium sp.]|uniref:peptide chain release factor H n=1 Tax=Roseibium sp. TaxID=1936156 RepID=UPI001B05A7A0|nr:peptide chain release factor H [Roseibium sp.]MBO6893364.1 peptide chain release factor H [Roseibium sp.]MBO6932861.1 peptide chain release factor H [Roseibium sp.]
MSRQDQIRLLVTSGDGPRECRRAVSLVIRRIEREALKNRLQVVAETSGSDRSGDPASALVTLTGQGAEKLAKEWTGTIRWICKSPFRPHHKRQNWFVGVFPIAEISETENLDLGPAHLKIETFRAGGPGGQHVNKTDSAVRITHLPTGLSAVSEDERSQFRNRKTALERLTTKWILQQQLEVAADRSKQNRLHKQLERGNSTRVFLGEKFAEKSG